MSALNPNIYAYLWSPTRQMLDRNGKPLIGGYVMINKSGTTGIPAISYADWNGTLNPRQIRLDSLGRATAIVDNEQKYDMYVYNIYNVLQYSSLGINCEGSPVRIISSDGSIDVTRVDNSVDLRVHNEENIYCKAVADSTGSEGLIEFDTIESGNITVVSAGVLKIETNKLYHVTVSIEFNTSTANSAYCDCKIVDSEGVIHNFTLDASRTKQIKELSWDIYATSEDFHLHINAPSIFSIVSAELYIHALSTVSGGGGGGGPFVQEQANWTETDPESPSYIKHKPDMADYARIADLANVAFSGDYLDLSNTPNLSVYARSASLSSVAFSGSYNDLSDKPNFSVYARIADLAAVAFSGSYDDLSDKPNLSVFARSADLATVATSGSYNDLSDAPAHLVQDANYVHTDNNFTDSLKSKLDGIEAGAEANVQSNWTQTNSNAEDFIKNKPATKTLVPGSGIDIDETSDTVTIRATGGSSQSQILFFTPTNSASNDASTIQAAITAGKNVILQAQDGNFSVELSITYFRENQDYRFIGWLGSKTIYIQTLKKTDNTWAWTGPTKKAIVPDYSLSQAGHVLSVDSTGTSTEWTPMSGSGGVQDVEYNGSSVVNAQGVAEIPAPSYPVTDVTVDGTSVLSNGVAAITLPTPPVSDVTVDGTSVLSNGVAAITMPTVDQTYNSSSTNAQSGAAVAGALSNLDQVPAVESGDNGSVLTASYSGGVGSYSWQPASGGGGSGEPAWNYTEKSITMSGSGNSSRFTINEDNPVGYYTSGLGYTHDTNYTDINIRENANAMKHDWSFKFTGNLRHFVTINIYDSNNTLSTRYNMHSIGNGAVNKIALGSGTIEVSNGANTSSYGPVLIEKHGNTIHVYAG